MTITLDELDELVKSAYTNATENEFYFLGWTDEAIADDMLDCDDDIYNYFESDNGETQVDKFNQIVESIHAFRAGL